MQYHHTILATAILSFSVFLSPVHAAPEDNDSDQAQDIAEVHKTSGEVSISAKNTSQYASVTVTGPNGLYVQENLNDADLVLNTSSKSGLEDGVYNYEIVSVSDTPKQTSYKESLDNGRSNQKRPALAQYEPNIQSGVIVVKNGQIITNATSDLTGEK